MADAWGSSWGGTFIVWGAAEQVTAAQYGEPFLDGTAMMLTSLGLQSLVPTFIGGPAITPGAIEGNAYIGTTRISRSVKNV
jgi:hypothetical protein